MVTVMHLSPLVISNQSTIFRQEYKRTHCSSSRHPIRGSPDLPRPQQYHEHHKQPLHPQHNFYRPQSGPQCTGRDQRELLGWSVGTSDGCFFQFNQIQYIWPSAFSNLPHLEGLYLKSNKLKTLSVSIFDPHHHPVIIHLTLQRNPLKFDSRLCWLQGGIEDGWIMAMDLDGLDSMQCSLLSTKGLHSSSVFEPVVLN